VLFNSASTLAAYAAGLAPALRAGVADLIAVDNASPDESAAALSALLPDATVLRSPSNGGFAAGCNLAWPLVHGRYWLLLNPDVYADAEGIRGLVEWMERHPRVGLASPLIQRPDGERIPVAIPHDSLWRPLIEALRLHKFIPEPLRSQLLLSGRKETPEEIKGWITGAAMIARSETVRSVGLMDAEFFMYGEEREWCWRIARAGWAIGLCQQVEFVHEKGASATATWGFEQRTQREVAGHLRASRKMRGDTFTRLLALCLGGTLWLAAKDPRRRREDNQEQLLRAHQYLKSWVRFPAIDPPA
jgi:hypothetical protein